MGDREHQNNASSLGASGREDAHKFYPWDLTIVVGKAVDPVVKKLHDAGHLNLLIDEKHDIYQPRANRGIKESTVESIAPKADGGEGQIHNIKVWRDGPQKLVLVGRGRVKAIAMRNYRICEKMGKTKEAVLKMKDGDKILQKVIALVHKGDQGSAWRVMTAENEERDDSTLLEKLVDAQRGLELGVDEKDVARLLRVDVPTLKLKMKFLDLHKDVQAAIMAGELAESKGYLEFSKWTRDEQAKNLSAMREAGTLKGHAADVAISQLKAGKTVTPKTAGAGAGDGSGRRAPNKKKVSTWVETLKEVAEKDVYAAGMRAGLMKALGMQVRGMPDKVKKLLAEE